MTDYASMLPIKRPDYCPPAHDGCRCSCHTTPGIVHCMPCCGPGRPLRKFGREFEFEMSPPDEFPDAEADNDGETYV